MNVLLVRPPRRDSRDISLKVPPIGLAYIAGSLREAGIAVDVLDALGLDLSWDAFAQAVRMRRPDVVGIGAMTPTADIAARAARVCRPYTDRIVLGGPHPTAVGAKVLEEMPEVDALVLGEGEQSFPELIQTWERGDTALPQGICMRGVEFSPRSPPSDVDALAWPARDLLPNARYRYLLASRSRFTTMITSRGCPFRCSFCDRSVGGRRWRARSAESVVDELEHVVDRFGVGFISFYDDNFTFKPSRVAEICELILSRGIDVEWKCEGRVDNTDPELLRLMRAAGCRLIAFGVESGNEASLRRLRKDIDLSESRRAFAQTREAGIRSLAYMILGVPGETANEVRKSSAFAREIGADYVQFSTLAAYPGTSLDPQQLTDGSAVSNPFDADSARSTVTDIPPEILTSLMQEAWRGFYLRPRPMARFVRDVWRSGSYREAGRIGRAVAGWAAS